MNKKEFKKIVFDYYEKNKRQFPWRETANPYYIFLSEIMLQQTQTSRVVEKYHLFTNLFPTPQDLAKASLPEVLSAWSGLGYNRRAKYLKESAQILTDRYRGEISKDVQALDELPGIGINTASAIVVYSFNIPLTFIETNIRRVYLHHFFSNEMQVHDREILKLVSETVDTKNPREWYWSLMDYGSFLAKSLDNPNKRSKHYTRQSSFEGSVRQVRGSIVKTLLTNPMLSKRSLKQQITGNTDHFETALNQLVTEGFISIKKDEISLKD